MNGFQGQPKKGGFQGTVQTGQHRILMTTAPTMVGFRVVRQLGIVQGIAINVPNFVQDFFANFREKIGGRVKDFENELIKARDTASMEMQEDALALGANAIVMVDFDFSVAGKDAQMFLVSVTGTAQVVEPEAVESAPSPTPRITAPPASPTKIPSEEPSLFSGLRPMGLAEKREEPSGVKNNIEKPLLPEAGRGPRRPADEDGFAPPAAEPEEPFK